jgi:rhodanese-related sulfurtransferase
MRRTASLVALALVLAPLAACSSSEGAAGGDTGPDGAWAEVIDVRTAEEYAEGHVAGALLMDVQAADFATQVAALPTDGDYLVYCRSGNRAGTAVEQMADAGLSATNAGGLQDMLDAGWSLGD